MHDVRRSFRLLTIIIITRVLLSILQSGGVNIDESLLASQTSGRSSFRASNSTQDEILDGHAVVYLNGELGNHMMKIALFRAAHVMARRELNVNLKLHLHGQGAKFGAKPKRAARDCKKCLIKMRNMDFTECNNAEFDSLKKRQSQLIRDYGLDAGKIELGTNSGGLNVSTLRDGMKYYAMMLRNKDFVAAANNDASNRMNLSLPFVSLGTFVDNEMIDLYHNDIQEYFAFNNECCKATPDPNETVFHYRGFTEEMPRVGRRYGFSELSPNRTASQLLGHLGKGSKVVILSRFSNGRVVKYRDALKEKGLSVRIVEGQTGPEDFCFMMNATSLYGFWRSSFAYWAVLLSSSLEDVTLYSMNYSQHRVRRPYVWQDERLHKMLHHPVFDGDSRD